MFFLELFCNFVNPCTLLIEDARWIVWRWTWGPQPKGQRVIVYSPSLYLACISCASSDSKYSHRSCNLPRAKEVLESKQASANPAHGRSWDVVQALNPLLL